MSSSIQSNFLNIEDVSNLIINNTQISQNLGFRTVSNKTSGVLLTRLKNLVINSSIFRNLQTYSDLGGGALRIVDSDPFRDSSTD